MRTQTGKTRPFLASTTYPKMVAGRLITACAARRLVLLLLWAVPAAGQAQFDYTNINGAITITKYTGAGGAVTIPGTINVTSLRRRAFFGCTRLTEVYFQGTPPSVGLNVFEGATNGTISYLPGTTGWDSTFGGRPTALKSR